MKSLCGVNVKIKSETEPQQYVNKDTLILHKVT